jgi:hypothetical protein
MALLQKGYLGATPLFKERSWFEDVSGKPINDSGAVTVTANSNAHTKGAWTELIASTSANASLLVLDIDADITNTDSATLIDIATGAATSETAIISNVAIGGAVRSSLRPTFAFAVPFKIASGTRISARIQSVVTGGKTASVVARIFDMGDYSYAPTSVDVLGTSTATSEGTAMSGAAGTWVEIISSTANTYKALVIVPSTTAPAIAGSLFVEYVTGQGALGAEQEIGRLVAQYNTDETCGISSIYPTLVGTQIAAGTRLAVKHDIAANPDRYDVTLIGIR